MVAALLGDTPTTLTNVPSIGNVDITKKMLNGLNSNKRWSGIRLHHGILLMILAEFFSIRSIFIYNIPYYYHTY